MHTPVISDKGPEIGDCGHVLHHHQRQVISENVGSMGLVGVSLGSSHYSYDVRAPEVYVLNGVYFIRLSCDLINIWC